ncbi:DUF4126 domain-containing protein [Corticibacter populi]|uniref:DUF4126 domain-containing protein n=1 Tax=Corticibacter populi TaxID=1550736 RepID=A0A3M6QM05_9BURK|nr:DUF4126 domain-containing protein [Corticibacter populi]RMX04077.1 DUF4126 domain-containing protein [Corticibacter populi]RZS33084.1 uncharacterized protein DUF4126 [Corticibacter populi]
MATEDTSPTRQSLTERVIDGLHSAGLHLDGAAVQGTASELGGHVEKALGSMDMTSLLALAAALGWASGLRLYAVVFAIGLAGYLEWLTLPGALGVLQSPVVLFFSGIMLFAEFFADKIPGLDSLWDLLQSVIRVPAGAALAASVFGADNASMAMVAALMGGTLAATSQAAKTTTRAAINTSPEPLSNVGASLAEDGASIGAIWLALTNPLVFIVVLVFAVLGMWAITWLMFRFLRAAWRRFRRFFGTDPAPPHPSP